MNRSGYTLKQLIIAVTILMLLASCWAWWYRSLPSIPRQNFYTNARYALDLMEIDLMGCLPSSSEESMFVMENGVVQNPAVDPITTYGTRGGHLGTAADRITFRTMTAVGDTLQRCEVTYELIPGAKPGGAVTERTGRPVYALIRRVRVPGPDAAQPWTQQPQDSDGQTIGDMELCPFVLSFNLEYLSDGVSFSQLGTSWDTTLRVPAIRVTMVVIEGVEERNERIFQKVMTIPIE